MSVAHPVLAPTSSLPRLRNATEDVSEEAIASALRNLTDIYCPLPRAAAFRKPSTSLRRQKDDYLAAVPISTDAASPPSTASSGTSTPGPVDSGYASGQDDGDDDDDEEEKHGKDNKEDMLAALRADEYERQCAIRWLTGFIARAEELLLASDDDARQRLIDDASYILASFSSATTAEEDEDAGAIAREFRFQVAGAAAAVGREEEEEEEGNTSNYIEVHLTDGTPATGSDHTDVGLQSWGASIVISDLMCSSPEQFGLTVEQMGTPSPRVIELGAGTGLVGITMAKLLPRLGMPGAEVIATDYHPAVLANLAANVAANFGPTNNKKKPPVQACLLDWAAPCLDAPLDRRADMLVATDVVYAPEHAVWLRDCAAQLLAREGVFWLIASVRPNGRFEGVTDTVESAFADRGACPRWEGEEEEVVVLRILGQERLEKRQGVGRADEIGYKVFRIGWGEW